MAAASNHCFITSMIARWYIDDVSQVFHVRFYTQNYVRLHLEKYRQIISEICEKKYYPKYPKNDIRKIQKILSEISEKAKFLETELAWLVVWIRWRCTLACLGPARSSSIRWITLTNLITQPFVPFGGLPITCPFGWPSLVQLVAHKFFTLSGSATESSPLQDVCPNQQPTSCL